MRQTPHAERDLKHIPEATVIVRPICPLLYLLNWHNVIHLILYLSVVMTVSLYLIRS